jgi:F0F1-type ATP synthase membrane subunit b/b'
VTEDLRDAAVKESEVVVGSAEVQAEKILDAAHRRAATLGEEIRELRGLRARFALALRSTIEQHLALVESIEDSAEEDSGEAVVTYLARTISTRDATSEGNGGS